MDKYRKLLTEWCDYLSASQIIDKKSEYFGGFSCEACPIIHGRADNAIYPLITAYSFTNDGKYLHSAENLLVFRKSLTHPDGAVQNDFQSEWKGISTFSAIYLLKTVIDFSDILPEVFLTALTGAAFSTAQWVYENINTGFRANINYYAAASTVNALMWDFSGDKKYRERASELLSYCLARFTPNGILTGEGQPHDFRTESGCAPVDIGYNIEESLPCLTETAFLLNDEKAIRRLSEYGERMLEFLLPDGGIDNSFGVRNNKWTYYGSRTSDGAIGAFTMLGCKNELFKTAAERTFGILRECTHGGRLYGGRYYPENGQPPCIHHTFSHACALARAVNSGITAPKEIQKLPSEGNVNMLHYYPEINTCKITTGNFLATVTAYDYRTYTYTNGAAHSGGGTLSLLYRKGRGTAIAGSVFEYKPTEANNMQLPSGDIVHSSLIPRFEFTKDGRTYSSCLDEKAKTVTQVSGRNIRIGVTSQLVAVDGAESGIFVEAVWIFSDYRVTLEINKTPQTVKFILPLIHNSAEMHTENKFTERSIFFLSGGFGATEYSFSTEDDILIALT